MVDVVGFPHIVFEVDQVVDRREDILRGENAHGVGNVQAQFFVEFVAPHSPEVVAFWIEEARFEQRSPPRYRGRLTRTQLAIQFHQGFFFAELPFFFDGFLEVLRMAQGIENFVICESEGFEQDLG